jgi:uncharacterized protein YegP (UPF0339 family)
MRTGRTEIYRNAAGKWNFRIIAANGKVVAQSNQGYERINKAFKGLQATYKALTQGQVYEVDNDN